LDNGRLLALQQAAVEIPYRVVDPEDVAQEFEEEVGNAESWRFDRDSRRWRHIAMNAEDVVTWRDLAQFLRGLERRVEVEPNSVENNSLPSFLEAASAWVDAMEGIAMNRNQPVPDQPTWSLVAEIFDAALIYE
jgi:hypothetical protein